VPSSRLRWAARSLLAAAAAGAFVSTASHHAGLMSLIAISGKCADTIGTVPVRWACHFSAEILIYFSNKIYGGNFIKQHSETVMV